MKSIRSGLSQNSNPRNRKVSRIKLAKFLYNKFIDYMKEEKIPPVPTREQELEYLDFLEKSIDSDPWITIHPKQYMAGPHRLRYKKRIEMRKEYYKTYAKNFLISVTLSWPLIML